MQNFGLKLFDYTNVYVTNSIFASNETYGIGIYTEHPELEVSYSLFWENIESDCMEIELTIDFQNSTEFGFNEIHFFIFLIAFLCSLNS